MVDIGKLNKRITFLRPVQARDSLGQDRLSYEPHVTVWATVKPYKSNDRSLMGKKSPEVSHKFYVRYRRDLAADMRITYRGRDFAIIGEPVDIDERHELLEIQAEALV